MWRAETLLRKHAKNIHCVVHATSSDWLLVEEISEHHFDGFALISRWSVLQRRYNRFDKTFEKVLRHLGEQPGTPPITIDGDDREIFDRLSRIDTVITLESEDESRFLIGRIHRVTKSRIFMKHFPADGKWFDRASGVDFSEIGRVCFGDEYGRGWQSYLAANSQKSRK